MTKPILNYRCAALLASTLTTLTLLTAILGPGEQAREPRIIAVSLKFALADGEQPCRFPQAGKSEAWPCLPKPPRPAPRAQA